MGGGGYLLANVSFRGFVAISGSEKYSFKLFIFSATCVPEKTVNIKSCIFGVGNFDARYFFGCKISGLCILGGLQYEAPSDAPPPPHQVYFEYPPPPPPGAISYLAGCKMPLTTCFNGLKLDIVLESHACKSAQATDYSLICKKISE